MCRKAYTLQGGSPQDDKLVLNKHSMVYPTDEEVGEHYIEFCY